MEAVARFTLSAKRPGGDRRRIGVRHLEYTRHPAHHCGASARGEVFLVRGPGFTKMHLCIYDPGKNMKAGTFEDAACLSL